jgi:hypothetical protein
VVARFLMLIERCLSIRVRLQTMVRGDASVMTKTPSRVANYIHLYLMIA